MRSLADFQNELLPKFMFDFEGFVNNNFENTYSELKSLFRYHIGFDDSVSKQGKHIRPLLTLLCCAGTGTDWQFAIPAAISIELIHNFSLIHDDIEDDGALRRGKDAVWVKWGIAQGLNAGDAMFALAFKALFGLKKLVPEGIVLNAAELLTDTCQHLTQGQFLDIDFEKRESVSANDYFCMIKGKTAALISCCTKMGSLIGESSQINQEYYHEFGEALGTTFQIYDDWLGIWGESAITGKSATNDIVAAKKTLPIILGIKNSARFGERMRRGGIVEKEAVDMAKWLRQDGVEDLVIEAIQIWNDKALLTLEKIECVREVKEALREFTNKLLIRKK